MKNSSLKTKCKNIRIFHVQLLSQVLTEGYSHYQAANNKNTNAILAPFN